MGETRICVYDVWMKTCKQESCDQITSFSPT